MINSASPTISLNRCHVDKRFLIGTSSIAVSELASTSSKSAMPSKSESWKAYSHTALATCQRRSNVFERIARAGFIQSDEMATKKRRVHKRKPVTFLCHLCLFVAKRSGASPRDIDRRVCCPFLIAPCRASVDGLAIWPLFRTVQMSVVFGKLNNDV